MCSHALTSVHVVAGARIFRALGVGADLGDRLGRQSPQSAPGVAKYLTRLAHLLSLHDALSDTLRARFSTKLHKTFMIFGASE